jgi:hypothetical protein
LHPDLGEKGRVSGGWGDARTRRSRRAAASPDRQGGGGGCRPRVLRVR